MKAVTKTQVQLYHQRIIIHSVLNSEYYGLDLAFFWKKDHAKYFVGQCLRQSSPLAMK